MLKHLAPDQSVNQTQRRPNSTNRWLIGIVAPALVLAACNNKNTNGSQAKIHNCSSSDSRNDSYLFEKGSDTAVVSTETLVKQAITDIVLLDSRALKNGGKINLNEHRATEITAHTGKLVLAYPGPAGSVPGTRTDTLTFPITSAGPQVASQAITCFSGNNLYPNKAFTDMQQYVIDTEALSR